jgi:class 3 adenylate cyclase
MAALRLEDLYRAEARRNARVLDAVRAGSTGAFLVFQEIVSRAPETDVDRVQSQQIVLPMLAGYFVVAFLTMLLAPTARWVKYLSVTIDAVYLCALYHLLYRAQYPEPVQFPFAPALFLTLVIATSYLRYSVVCSAYGGAVAITGYLYLGARWGMPAIAVGQAAMALAILTGVIMVAVRRSQQLALRAAEREVTRALLEEKLPRRVAAALLDDEDRRDIMAVQAAEVSVLCVEVHEFAAMAELRTPREVADLVERFAAVANEAVFRQGGSIERFQGDRLVALFGAPLPQKHHPQAAVTAALVLRDALEKLNSERPPEAPALHAGFAVHTGDAIVGVMGRPGHGEYTAIGETVHLAAKLRSETSRDGGEILVSERTYHRIRADFVCKQAQPLAVAGRRTPMPVWRVERAADVVTESTPESSAGAA